MTRNTFAEEPVKPEHKDYKTLTGTIRYRLTNDYMFRAVMQKNKNILKHLVCAILGIQPETVSELDICNPIVLGEEINAKSCILDIKVLLNNRQYLNIEMQVSKQNYWKQRSLTYLCKTYDSLDSGQNYFKRKAGRRYTCWQKKMKYLTNAFIPWHSLPKTKKSECSARPLRIIA